MSAQAPGAAKPVDIATQSLMRPAVVMAAGTALSRLTGLGRVVTMALALGVAESRLADAYNLANTLPLVLYELVLGGVLTSVFIPVLVQELRTKERREAWESVSALVTAAAIALCAVTLITVAVAPWVIDLFTERVPGSAAARSSASSPPSSCACSRPRSRSSASPPSPAACSTRTVASAPPTFSPILNNLVLMATFVVFAALTTGVTSSARGRGRHRAEAAARRRRDGRGRVPWRRSTGPTCRACPGRVRLRVDFGHPAVRKLARLSAWTVAYVATNTAGFAVSFYLASGVQGGLTAYVTAFAFFQLPIGIAATSIVTALVPKLAAHHVDGDTEAFRRADR